MPRPACKFAWRSLALTISVDGDLVITTATTGTTRFEIIFMVFDQFQFSHRSVWHHSFNLDRRWWRHSQLKPIWPHSQYLVYFKCQQRFLKVRIILGDPNSPLFLAPVLDETTQAQLVLRNLAEIGKRIPDLAAILNPTLPPGITRAANCTGFSVSDFDRDF